MFFTFLVPRMIHIAVQKTFSIIHPYKIDALKVGETKFEKLPLHVGQNHMLKVLFNNVISSCHKES